MMKRSYGAMIVLLAVGGCKSASGPAPVVEKSIVQKVEDGGINEADLNRADAADATLVRETSRGRAERGLTMQSRDER